MNTAKLSLLMAALLATGSSAIASDQWTGRGDRDDNWENRIVSTKTRAEVIAETNAARVKGEVMRGGEAGSAMPVATASSRSRADVREEARLAGRVSQGETGGWQESVTSSGR